MRYILSSLFGEAAGQEGLWPGHRLGRVSDSEREGANITYGYSQKEKGRVRRQAYRPFQEASSFLRYLAGTP